MLAGSCAALTAVESEPTATESTVLRGDYAVDLLREREAVLLGAGAIAASEPSNRAMSMQRKQHGIHVSSMAWRGAHAMHGHEAARTYQ